MNAFPAVRYLTILNFLRRNTYLASGPKQALGYAFGIWSESSLYQEAPSIRLVFHSGFGSVVSPLTCQAIIARGVPWPKFYFGSLVVSATNIAFLLYAFRPTLKEFATERQDALDAVKLRLAALEREGSTSIEPQDHFPAQSSRNGSRSSSVTRVDAPPPVNSECILATFKLRIFLMLCKLCVALFRCRTNGHFPCLHGCITAGSFRTPSMMSLAQHSLQYSETTTQGFVSRAYLLRSLRCSPVDFTQMVTYLLVTRVCTHPSHATTWH